MLSNVAKNSIKITLVGFFALTALNAADIKWSHAIDEERESDLNPNAQEFIPGKEIREQTRECNDTIYDIPVDSMCDTPVDPIWMYYDWTYQPFDYPDDMKPTHKIKSLLKTHRRILTEESPAAFAQSYIALGDAHMDHLCSIQMYYYNVALGIGYQIDDVKIIEKACVAFGNMLFTNYHYAEGIAWYHEAHRLGNTRVEGVVRKAKSETERDLQNKHTQESLTQNQVEAIKVFFPRLASLYC